MGNRKKNQIGIVSMLIILTFILAGCGNKAKSYYQTAVKQYNQGEYETSAENFEKAIELKDDNADYYIDYAYCLAALKDYDKAEETFQKAILDKVNSIVNKNNKKAYRGLGIVNYMKGDYEQALEFFEKAMEYDSLNEYDVDIVSYMGSTNLMLGNYEEAAANFTTVIESKPKNVIALISRGEVYYQLGRYEESITDYTAAKKLDRENYDVYFGLYQSYEASGDSTNAAAILEEASQLTIEDDEDKFNLAKVQYYQGNEDQALDAFKSASEQGYTESYLYLGNIYLANEDEASALYYFELYQQEATPTDASFYNKLGTCYLNTGDYENALSVIESGLKYAGSQNKKSLLKNEIIAYEYLGDFTTAYTKMETYLAAYPDDEDAKRDMEFLETRQSSQDTEESEESEESEKSDEIVKP